MFLCGLLLDFNNETDKTPINWKMILFVDYLLLAQAIIGTKKYPDAGIILSYDDDDYSQGYHQIKEAFKALTKIDLFKPYKFDDDFRPSNIRADDVGYNLYVFDIRYQQNFSASQPVKVEFEFDGVVPNDINGYALVLTNKLVSISSVGQRHFDLI